MLSAAEKGVDLVVASRYAPGGSSRGLDGIVRHSVSRGAARLAQALFTEARQSSDPLSGFFLCRRTALDGIEFRPVGFKILLELLICVPRLRVQDVPLQFARREAGVSKASTRQGVLYLRHLASLVFQVDGSARAWKFGLVGLSGLGVFLPLVWVLSGLRGVPSLLAFVPAFLASLAWNSILNRWWTFADQRRGLGEGMRGYLPRALASGLAMFAAYATALSAAVAPLSAALAAALIGMGVNGPVIARLSTALPVRGAASPSRRRSKWRWHPWRVTSAEIEPTYSPPVPPPRAGSRHHWSRALSSSGARRC